MHSENASTSLLIMTNCKNMALMHFAKTAMKEQEVLCIRHTFPELGRDIYLYT